MRLLDPAFADNDNSSAKLFACELVQRREICKVQERAIYYLVAAGTERSIDLRSVWFAVDDLLTQGATCVY